MALRERSKADTDLTEAMFMDAPVTHAEIEVALEKQNKKVDGWFKKNEQATASQFDDVNDRLDRHERLLLVIAEAVGVEEPASYLEPPA